MCKRISVHGDALQQIVELPTDKIGIGVKKFMTLSRLTLLHTNVKFSRKIAFRKPNDIIGLVRSPLELDMKLGSRHWHSYRSTS